MAQWISLCCPTINGSYQVPHHTYQEEGRDSPSLPSYCRVYEWLAASVSGITFAILQASILVCSLLNVSRSDRGLKFSGQWALCLVVVYTQQFCVTSRNLLYFLLGQVQIGRSWTELDDEVGRWILEDWVMDDDSQVRVYYKRCSDTGMVFERILVRKEST